MGSLRKREKMGKETTERAGGLFTFGVRIRYGVKGVDVRFLQKFSNKIHFFSFFLIAENKIILLLSCCRLEEFLKIDFGALRFEKQI